MCHRDSNCGAQTCRRCESVIENLPTTRFDLESTVPTIRSYESVYLVYVQSVKDGDKETAAILCALLRDMHWRMGGR